MNGTNHQQTVGQPPRTSAKEWTVAVGGSQREVVGSGVLFITTHGRVVITCAHVVRQLHQQEVRVRLSQSLVPGQQWTAARVVYCAPPDHRFWDLAVLALNDTEEGSNRCYGDRAPDGFAPVKFAFREGLAVCNMDTNPLEKGLAVFMLGYPVSSATGDSTSQATLTARRASVVDTFHDRAICRRNTRICSSPEAAVSRRANNNTFHLNKTTHDESPPDLCGVAVLLAGSALPGMSGGPVLQVTSDGACLVGIIVTGVWVAGRDDVAGVLAVPAWPVLAALRLYHHSGDEIVFERTLRRPSLELARLWPQPLPSKL